MKVNMENEELVKMFNPTLKMRETILFFLIVVINGLIWIDSDIKLDTCTKGRWRVEICKIVSSVSYTILACETLGEYRCGTGQRPSEG